MKKPSELVEGAIEEIDSRGWTKDAFESHAPGEEGRVCILGGLNYFTFGFAGDFIRHEPSSPYEIARRALNILAFEQGSDCVVGYNDTICNSQEEAIEFLTTAAKRLRDEGQ